MASPSPRTPALQPTTTPRREAHRPDILGTTSGIVTTACEVVKEIGGLLEKVPYVEAIAGVVVKIATIRDEIKSNRDRCTKLIERVCVDWDAVSSNLMRVASSSHPELLDNLKNDLHEYLQILERIQSALSKWAAGGFRGKISRFTKRGDFKDLMEQYDRQISAFHQRFSMNQLVGISIATAEHSGIETRAAVIISQPLPPKPRVVVGRDEDILKILDALKSHDKTPVRAAVLGPGGMGKTTIALSILHHNDIELRYKTERYFISCESATNAELLLNNIADTLGFPSAGREQNKLTSQVNAFFRDRHAVLCFDNLETTWDDPAHRPEVDKVLGFLSTVPTLVIIVTMRGAQSPGGHDIRWLKVEIKPVANEDALNIYRRRTGKDPDEWACKLIGGVENIPLAVTIISHLVQEDGQIPEVLWARWERQRTRVLENGGMDRLSSLDASILLSVQSPRMDDKSRNLLYLLAFLPDGLHSEFTFKIPLPGVPDLSSLLITLQRVSLIYTSPIPDSTATRYNMLYPIREYCQNATNFTPPPWHEWRSAFTEFFANLVGEHWDPTNAMNYSIVVPELRNIRSILMETTQESIPNTLSAIWYTEWSRYIGVCDEEVIVNSLQFMHDPSDLAHGYRTLGIVQQQKDKLEGAEDSFRKSLQFSEQAGDSLAKPRALECIGDLHLRRDSLDEAESSLSLAQVLYDEVGSIGDRANVRFSIAELHMSRHNLDDAECSYSLSLPLYQRAQDVLGQANVHNRMGELHMARGDLCDAEKSFAEALPLHQQIQDIPGQASVHCSMGELYMERGDLDDAEKSFSTALHLYHQMQDVLGQANVHCNMGELHMKRSDPDNAEKCFSIALPLYRQTQDVLGQANVHCTMGELRMERGDLDDAEKSFSTSIALYQQIQDVDGQANVHCNMGELHMQRGDLDDAEKSFFTALPLYRQIQSVLGQADVHSNMGELYMKRGNLDDARKSFSTALPLYQQMQDVNGQAYVHDELGKLHLERDNLDAAAASFSTSLALYEQVQHIPSQEVVRSNLRRLEERKAAMGLGDNSIGEAASLS